VSTCQPPHSIIQSVGSVRTVGDSKKEVLDNEFRYIPDENYL